MKTTMMIRMVLMVIICTMSMNVTFGQGSKMLPNNSNSKNLSNPNSDPAKTYTVGTNTTQKGKQNKFYKGRSAEAREAQIRAKEQRKLAQEQKKLAKAKRNEERKIALANAKAERKRIQAEKSKSFGNGQASKKNITTPKSMEMKQGR